MKTILSGIFILIITLACSLNTGSMPGENGTLSGVITFKDASANQADRGGEIYVVSEADVRSTPYKDIAMVFEAFQNNKSIYSLSMYNNLDPAVTKKAQDNFDTLANFASTYISGFKQLPSVVRTITNNSGNYSLSLRPGKYYILVVSGSVRSNNIAESKGNMYLKSVDIKKVEETFLDVNFKMDDMLMLIYQNSRKNLAGC